MQFYYWRNNLIFAIFFGSVIISIDYITNYFFSNYYIISTKLTLNQTLISFVLFFWISFLKSRNFWTLFFIGLSLLEVGYYSFFRGYIEPYQIDLLFSEYKDIIDSLKDILIPIFLIISFFIIFYFLLKLIKKKYNLISYPILDIIFLISFIGVLSYPHFKQGYMKISPLNYSFINMSYTLALYLNSFFDVVKNKNFKNYKLQYIGQEKNNIIVVMGESLSYKRMHIFGFDLNNTPYLESLKNDKRFCYAKAISIGVNTPVSVTSFFNLKREPENSDLLIKETANLLKLAKQKGYKVYWISKQEEGVSISSLLKYADVIKVSKDWNDKSYDEVLLKYLKNIDWNRKNFIVLHFRANHSPYQENIPIKNDYSKENYHNFMLYSYNDSVKYVDKLIYKIFKYVAKHSKDYVIYFTSDHGEMMGFKDEKGRYGHSILDFEVAKVPYFRYSDDNKCLLESNITNHYLIGKKILLDLGYKLINPNENGKYYINGVKLNGRRGFIEY